MSWLLTASHQVARPGAGRQGEREDSRGERVCVREKKEGALHVCAQAERSRGARDRPGGRAEARATCGRGHARKSSAAGRSHITDEQQPARRTQCDLALGYCWSVGGSTRPPPRVERAHGHALAYRKARTSSLREGDAATVRVPLPLAHLAVNGARHARFNGCAVLRGASECAAGETRLCQSILTSRL